MPISTLAIEMLRDYHINGGWNRRNYILESAQWGTAKSAADQRALSEAWSWLEARGLVAHDPQQSSEHSRFVTRLGLEALNEGVAKMDAAQRLGVQLHPIIAAKVERQFLLGEYELAVFAAMKAVEVRVRELGQFPNTALGTGLMQPAFAPSAPGPLVDANADPGEQVATMELFKGAIGVFKNPSSHRPVDYDDPTMAAEVILFADLLLRILDRQAGN